MKITKNSNNFFLKGAISHWESRRLNSNQFNSFDMSRKSKSKDQTKALNIPFTLTQGDLVQEALAVTFAKDQTQALNILVKVPLGGGRYAELTEWNGSKRVDLRFWEPIRFLPSMVSACLCHSGKSCVVLRKWWTIWPVERKTENRGLEISSGKRRLRHHQSPSTDNSHQENWHCILRREEWPWVFTNGKNWKRQYLYLKKENQNWELTMCKINHRNEYGTNT